MDFTYITVLDFGSGKVYQYNLADVGDNYLFKDKDEPQAEEVEELLIDQGHNLFDTQWMIHADPTINQIKL
jgi:predicted aldo/keto reductase-like oxidoreductase